MRSKMIPNRKVCLGNLKKFLTDNITLPSLYELHERCDGNVMIKFKSSGNGYNMISAEELNDRLLEFCDSIQLRCDRVWDGDEPLIDRSLLHLVDFSPESMHSERF